MPEFLAAITAFLPLTYVIEALRGDRQRGRRPEPLGPQLLGHGRLGGDQLRHRVRLFRWE